MILHALKPQQFASQVFQRPRRVLSLTWLSVLISLSTSAAALETDSVIVLVPGFLNSLAPSTEGQYFAKPILEHYQKAGAEIVTIHEELSSAGHIEENGQKLIEALQAKLAAAPHLRGRRITVLGHSAGALFGLYAATHSELPIYKIVSISSPWQGADIVDKTPLNVLAKILDKNSISSLIQFKRENIEQMLNRWPARSQLRVVCLAGQQNPNWLGLNRAEYLSWPLSIAQSFIDAPSDGVISLESALPANGPHKPSWLGKWDFVDTSSYPTLHLDHLEQAVDSQIFLLLGVTNTEYIEREQLGFYDFILQQIL